MSNRPTSPFKRLVVEHELDVNDLTPFERALLGRLEAIEQTQDALLKGQTDLTVAFGTLKPIVEQLQKDAGFKEKALKVGKLVAGPLLGFAAHYLPGLASHIPAILEAIGAAAAAGTPGP